MNKELLRQLFHASGVFVVVLSYYMPMHLLIVLCVALVVFLEIIFRWDRFVFIPLFSSILRRCKRDEDERGSIYFFLGIIITLFIFQFNLQIANAAILILIFGDSASTLVGKKFGNKKLPFQKKKTWRGSLAFLFVGFLVALTQISPIAAIFGAISGAITEAYSPIDDNITIPIISAFFMALYLYFLIFL